MYDAKSDELVSVHDAKSAAEAAMLAHPGADAEAGRDDFNCVESSDSNRFYVREGL
jgi:hypothetical protein